MSLDQPISDSNLMILIKNVFQQNGVDLNRYKITFLKRRLEIRMKVKGMTDYSKYASLLKSDPNELIELFQSLSINVTQFFRDVQMFKVFSDMIIPQLLRGKRSSDKIRIWSAGCASGQEPYSIAVLFDNVLHNTKGPSVEIVATDVNKKAIEFATSGIYPNLTFQNFPPDLFLKYFNKIDSHENHTIQYEVHPKIKQMIEFKVGDILSNQQQLYDVIFCRNVLIYYTKEAHDLIFTKFHKSLKKPGYLILGMDETMLGTKSEQLFSFASIKERIYKCSD